MPGDDARGFQADWEAPLIGIPDTLNGRDVVLYFTSDKEADAAVGDHGAKRALERTGAWERPGLG